MSHPSETSYEPADEAAANAAPSFEEDTFATEVRDQGDGALRDPAPQHLQGETIDEVRSSLPIPAGPLHSRYTDGNDGGKRPSFWKRIKMRRRAVESVVEASASETAARLDTIEQTVEHFDTTLQAQLEALNARLEDVWESEEQLSHLADIQDKLDRLTALHEANARAIQGLSRTVTLLAGLVVVAVVGVGVALTVV